jgi:hypothetical protein
MGAESQRHAVSIGLTHLHCHGRAIQGEGAERDTAVRLHAKPRELLSEAARCGLGIHTPVRGVRAARAQVYACPTEADLILATGRDAATSLARCARSALTTRAGATTVRSTESSLAARGTPCRGLALLLFPLLALPGAGIAAKGRRDRARERQAAEELPQSSPGATRGERPSQGIEAAIIQRTPHGATAVSISHNPADRRLVAMIDAIGARLGAHREDSPFPGGAWHDEQRTLHRQYRTPPRGASGSGWNHAGQRSSGDVCIKRSLAALVRYPQTRVALSPTHRTLPAQHVSGVAGRNRSHDARFAAAEDRV